MASLGSQFIMGQCNHEVADICIVVHVSHALEGGAESILVRTVDTDFIVILVGKLYDLLAWNERAKVWLAFGTGRQFSFINITGSVLPWENVGRERYQYFMHLLDATARHNSFVSER